MRYFFIVCVAIFLNGCASKLAENEGEKVLDYSMTHSKKVEIKHSESSKTYVTITYLTPLKHELINQGNEKFVVGSYLSTNDNQEGATPLSAFAINGVQKEVTVTPLANDSPLLKLVTSSNAWSRYVLVEAPLSPSVKTELSFESDHSKRVSVTFQKDY